MERMDNTTDEEVAMKPLHRLAELMGVGVSFIGSDNQKHEIQDNVLVSVLGALGVDASTNETIERSTNDVLAYRHGRIVAPTVLHTVGKCDEVISFHGTKSCCAKSWCSTKCAARTMQR